MPAYYNEIDPFAAEWLRQLIAAGRIAPGEVDERSIVDVHSGDLRGFTQCHFFAGLGAWSYALRLAGWPDDRPVWTGSCPCQPFSAAGKGLGTADARHLWPELARLIAECRPATVFGEQVASKAGRGWLNAVRLDLEALGYGVGAADLCAAGVGAPHIRQRLYWVALPHDAQRRAEGPGGHDGHGPDAGRQEGPGDAQGCGGAGGLAHANRDGRCKGQRNDSAPRHWDTIATEGGDDRYDSTSPTSGFWSSPDWLLCRDGKWRPTQPSPQPLADGSAESLGRVCPEIVAEVEEEVNAAAMEAEIEPDALLRNVWNALAAEAPRLWAAGRLPGLHEAPFLLAFLRQLAEQGWRVAQRIPVPSAEVDRERVRMLRADDRASRSPHKYGLEGQPAGKHSDAVRVLPSVLARHAHSAWGDAYQAYAETCSPLASGAPARVGRLRGYGNAIVAQAAEEFIEAYQEVRWLA